uniref:Uncharacterized protein n=1 Tax=Octopus bimaculoides TaxID=37653 RepID=A0A0L8G0Z8_OCTBM
MSLLWRLTSYTPVNISELSARQLLSSYTHTFVFLSLSLSLVETGYTFVSKVSYLHEDARLL